MPSPLVLNRPKIQIVEDEPLVAWDLKLSLEGLGYDVVGLASAAGEALTMAQTHTPDLVLMDIRLQSDQHADQDGIQAATLIRRQLRIPVIFLTAHSDQATLQRAKTSHPHGYILKPFREKDLDAAIQLALHQAQQEGRQQTEITLLEQALSGLQHPLVIINRQGTVVYLNPAASALLVDEATPLIGKPLDTGIRWVSGSDQQPMAPSMAPLLDHGIPVSLPSDTAVLTLQDQVIPVQSPIEPLQDSAGTVVGAMILFQMESEKPSPHLWEAQQRLVRLKDDFLSTISHELRTPLTIMQMAIQLLKMGIKDPTQRNYLEILEKACREETTLVNDLLTLRRLQEHDYEPTQDYLDLATWLPALLDLWISPAHARQQSVYVELDPRPLRLQTDASCLERILRELLTNAIKHTPPGKTIQLQAYPDPLPSGQEGIRLVLKNEAEIPATELPFLLQQFYRGQEGDPWAKRGIGLGLALVNQLVQLLQGQIKIDSQAGWSTIQVWIPSGRGSFKKPLFP